IRWIETLVERTDGAFAERRVQNVWSADREAVPEGHPLAPEATRGEWPSRTLNCILAVLALLALLPVMVLVAALIKLTSRGPIFYLQERVGLDRRLPDPGPYNHRRGHDHGGRLFTIYKFRTMQVDAERLSGAVWAQQEDPRVTPLGRVLRQYRLDELPQLFNVLQGDMNIVGPRPERPAISPSCGATSPSTRCASGPSPASPAWPRSTTTTTARSTTCAPRWATTWSTSAARACAKTCASCSRPCPSSSCAAAAGKPSPR